jgi:hypothetical protein
LSADGLTTIGEFAHQGSILMKELNITASHVIGTGVVILTTLV